MSFLEDIIKEIDTTLDRLIIILKRDNYSDNIEYLKEDKFVYINLEKLNPDEIEECRQITEIAVREENKILIEDDLEKLVEDIKFNESSEGNKKLLNFFKDKIPENDWDALRAAIYIRKRFEERTTNYELVYKLKGDVINKYGNRGNKICNLCSAGYFESMLEPLYNEMMRLQLTPDDFLKRYNTIIEEEAFALFVTYNMSSPEVQNLIEMKIKRNRKYGIKFVRIHGIGRKNVETINEVLPYLSIEHQNLRKIVEEMETIINVKLWWS